MAIRPDRQKSNYKVYYGYHRLYDLTGIQANPVMTDIGIQCEIIGAHVMMDAGVQFDFALDDESIADSIMITSDEDRDDSNEDDSDDDYESNCSSSLESDIYEEDCDER